MSLENIGFYTLSDERAKNVSLQSPLQRCELILTSRCNFSCPYCRGINKEDKGDISFIDACKIVKIWSEHNLKNIRFSGGEPTLWNELNELIKFSKKSNIERIALSTNGSADFFVYEQLIKDGVNDFSISLDSCCSSTGNKMAGNISVWEKVVENIKKISKLCYTTVGVVLTDDNKHELNSIIDFAASLGVADIRIIPAAQISRKHENLENITIEQKFPILNYRIENFLENKNMRGLTNKDNNQCPLVLDDMVVLNGKHYPCIIYMREHGKEIGKMNKNISEIRKERHEWFKNHDCFKDEICKNNCLDVCIDYNNTVKLLNRFIY